MRVYRFIRSVAAFGLVLFGCFLSLTCSSDSNQSNFMYIKVNVSQLPADASSMTVNVTLDGAPQRHSPYTLTTPAPEFWIELDAGKTGQLSITINALQGQGCIEASTQVGQQIAGEPYIPVTAILAPVNPAQCQITVVVHGDGAASSQSPQITCRDQCTATWPFQQQVTMKALPDRPTAQYVWSGACSGSSDCQFTVNGPATVVVDFTPKVCTQDASKQFKWCWENPLIQGNSLFGAWVSPDNTVYAAGTNGTIIQWNGTAWTIMDTGTTSNLSALWGSSVTDIWAVGSAGTIIHYLNGKWSSVNSGTTRPLTSIWGTGPNDIWAVGSGIVHWDGNQWSSFSSGVSDLLTGVWAANANDAWAIGYSGAMTHWNGTSWNPVTSPTNQDLTGVWGSGPGDVWIAGYGTMLRWTGSAFISSGNFAGTSLGTVWGTGTNNIYVTKTGGSLAHWDGNQWASISSYSNGTLYGISGNGPSNVWAVGAAGSIVFYDGTSWKSSTQGISGDYTIVNAGWANSSLDAWAVGTTSYPGTPFALHWVNGTWSPVPLPSQSTLHAMWGTASDNVWAVGDNGTLIRWNGSVWTPFSADPSVFLVAIWGNGPNDIWAVGNRNAANGALLKWDGSSWNSVSGVPADTYNAIYVNEMEAWIGGNSGRVWHWNGNSSAWEQQTLGTFDNVQSISGTDNMNIYAASMRNGAYYWNGISWTGQNITGINSISKIWTVQRNEAWITHDHGVSRFDGTNWTLLDIGTINLLKGIFGVPTDFWVYGQGGTILHYRR